MSAAQGCRGLSEATPLGGPSPLAILGSWVALLWRNFLNLGTPCFCFILCVCESICIYACVSMCMPDAGRDQKEALDPLKLEL